MQLKQSLLAGKNAKRGYLGQIERCHGDGSSDRKMSVDGTDRPCGMACELVDNGLSDRAGTVQYPNEFLAKANRKITSSHAKSWLRLFFS
jgi:hypothetical protein